MRVYVIFVVLYMRTALLFQTSDGDPFSEKRSLFIKASTRDAGLRERAYGTAFFPLLLFGEKTDTPREGGLACTLCALMGRVQISENTTGLLI